MATLFTTKYRQTKVPIFGVCSILILVGYYSLKFIRRPHYTCLLDSCFVV
uniref:Uncharacterized protein n=1 Tax=Meloidogyne enterolobii TaxID=390850 RepID=A0A6V7WEF7_MELEN|nr:unnamed protein product [Meloidogyne enterolobii]